MADLEKELGTLATNVAGLKEKAEKAQEAFLEAKEAKLTAKEAQQAMENFKVEAAEAKSQAEAFKVKADEQDKLIQALREGQNELIARQKDMKLGGSSLKSYEAELE